MADEISIGKQAIKEVQDLRAELVKLSEDALKAGKNLSSISTPSGLNKNGADNAKTGAEIDALKAKYIALNETIVKKAEQSRLAEIRLQQQREKAFDSFEKNAKKEQDLLNKNSNAYNKTQTQITNLTKVYNDLAVRKARYNDLSEHEENRLVTLAKVNEKYNGLLKGTDALIGKNTRNVGNYGNSYNALGNSINQLSREAPAFANSINTGFMALSNNFPALFDAISGIREQNRLLVAEGKPTTSLFKQLVAGVFSWQTLLSVGVTLLTLYGGKLIDMAFGLSEAEKSQKALNEEMSNAKNAVTSESTQLQSLTSIVNDHNESSENRRLAYEEIKKTLPGLTSATYKEAIATGELTRATDLYILSLVQKNIVEAEAKSIAEEQTKLNKEVAKSYTEHIGKVEAFLQSLQPERQKKNIEKSLKAQIKAEQDAQQEIINNRQKSLVKSQEDYLKTQAKLKPFITPPEKDKKAKTEDTTPKVKALESNLKSIGTVITQVNEELSRLFTEKILTTDADELEVVNFQIEQLTKLKEQLNNVPTTDETILNPVIVKKTTEAVKQLSKEMKNYLNSFSSEFMSNSGFSETFSLLNDEIDGFGENFAVTFNAIAETAQEVFNFISNASQANFDAEKERLQSQYDVSLKYAGDNKAAQEKLAEDLEVKKKGIANRENKAKQQQAIFNIAIDTAQAIIGLWGNPGFPAAIPLTIAVGALGAAQIAVVASQKVPQYWMGGTHDGGLMMVNDGAGSNYRETIVTPDGKIMQPTGRNVLMDAPAGTEIFTHDMWQNQLNDMLQGNGINWHNHQQTNGISKADLEDVMLRTIGSQPTHHLGIDGKGVFDYTEKRGNITRQATKRGNGIGTRF